MFGKMMKQNLKKGIAALSIMGALAFAGGCTVSVEGLGDVAQWVDDVLNSYYYGYDCPGCGVTVIEYDD